MNEKTTTLTIVLIEDLEKGAYSGWFMEYPGYVSQSSTEAELVKNLGEIFYSMHNNKKMKEKWFAVSGVFLKSIPDGKESKLVQRIYDDCKTQEEAVGKFLFETSNAKDGYSLSIWQVTSFLVPVENKPLVESAAEKFEDFLAKDK